MTLSASQLDEIGNEDYNDVEKNLYITIDDNRAVRLVFDGQDSEGNGSEFDANTTLIFAEIGSSNGSDRITGTIKYIGHWAKAISIEERSELDSYAQSLIGVS